MKCISLNILAVIVGLICGGAVNMGLIFTGAAVLPPPDGVDVNNIESINAHIGEYSFAQLMSPFIAHAMGTLVGALVAATIARSCRFALAMVIGVLYLAGGTMAVKMISNSPIWFSTLDLVVAYIPMAFLGWWIAKSVRGDGPPACGAPAVQSTQD